MSLRWNRAELVYLCENYPHYTTQDIASQLKRGVTAVYSKASQLGLRKTGETLRLGGKLREAVKHNREVIS